VSRVRPHVRAGCGTRCPSAASTWHRGHVKSVPFYWVAGPAHRFNSERKCGSRETHHCFERPSVASGLTDRVFE